MIRIRHYNRGDLAMLLHYSAHNAWDQLSPAERVNADFKQVAQSAHQMIMGALGSQGGTCLIAEDEGKLAGYMAIGISPHAYTGEQEAQFVDILVNPHYRRRGIAYQLTRAGEEYCRRLNVVRIRLWIAAHNNASRGNAQKLGYELEGTVYIKPLQQLPAVLPDPSNRATDRLPWQRAPR